MNTCPACGGGLPGEVPDADVCGCGADWGPWAYGNDADTWRMIRHLLAVRSGHRCELCGRQLDAGHQGTVHHRLPRGAGGTRDPKVNDSGRPWSSVHPT